MCNTFFKVLCERIWLQNKGHSQIIGLVLIHVYFFTVSCHNLLLLIYV